MPDRPDDRPTSRPGGELSPAGPPTAPAARVCLRRRLLLVAVAFVVTWTVVVAVIGAATGLWQGRGPRGLRLAIGAVTVLVGLATAVAYRRVSRPVSDLLGAA